MLDRFFRLTEHKTSVRIELMAGLTTFLTMAYIIFVQPAVLSGALFGIKTGMDFGAVTTATCLSAAVATAIMALVARYPIALAPGMGENFFFVLSVIPAAAAAGFPEPWKVARGVGFISGVLFFLVYALGLREMIFDAISPSLKNSIAVGIGLFIAFIGLQNAGIIIKDPGTAVKLNAHFASPDFLIFTLGLVVMAALHTRRVRGALIIGMTLSTGVTIALKELLPRLTSSPAVAESMLMTRFSLAQSVLAAPPSLAPVFMQMDLAGAVSLTMWPFILIFLFMDVFDTIGTLIGVGEQGGFMRDNRLPRARQAMLADQAGTLVGACMGTSTVTSYIESITGVEAGGRTGLTGLTVAALFLLARFFSPAIAMVAGYPPITAPALVLVGSMMVQNVRKIDWSDASEATPSFLIMLGIPLSYSIGDGLALGFIAYPVIKLLSGRGGEVKWLTSVLAVVLFIYFVLIRSRVGGG